MSQIFQKIVQTECLSILPNTKPGIFLLHPIDGAVSELIALSNLLSRPAHVLSFPKEKFDSLPAMAAHQIQRIKELSPRGPYILGGYSFGALLAIEMCWQLTQAEGPGSIQALIILDQPNIKATSDLIHCGQFLMNATESVGRSPLPHEVRIKLQQQVDSPTSVRILKTENIIDELSLSFVVEKLEIYEACTGLMLKHDVNENPFVFPDHVLMIVSQESLKYLPFLGWEAFCSAAKPKIEIVETPHLKLLGKKFVGIVAQHINRFLQAMREHQ